MIIILSPVKSVKTNAYGQIVTIVKRSETIEAAVTKVGTGRKSGLEFKINGNLAVLLLKHNAQTLKNQYGNF